MVSSGVQPSCSRCVARDSALGCVAVLKCSIPQLHASRCRGYNGEWRHPSRPGVNRTRKGPQVAAAEGPSKEFKDRRDAEVSERVDEAAKRINEMVGEYNKEVYASKAVGYVTGDAPEKSEKEVMEEVVGRHLEELDELFLQVLTSFIQAASEQPEQKSIADLLSDMRKEILRRVSQKLPVELQLLDDMLALKTREERMKLIHAASKGELEGKSAVQLDRLQAAASQMVEDLEENPVVVDRQLLFKLCIAREEIETVGREVGWYQPDGGSPVPGSTTGEVDNRPQNLALHFQQVPTTAAAFLKELLIVGDSGLREALIRRMFSEDWQVLPDSKIVGKRKREAVRPGSFLTALGAMQYSLVEGEEASRDVNPAVKARLELIRQQTIEVLSVMGWNR